MNEIGVAHRFVGRFCETPSSAASDTDALQVEKRTAQGHSFHVQILAVLLFFIALPQVVRAAESRNPLRPSTS
jgi:hypothetical protein